LRALVPALTLSLAGCAIWSIGDDPRGIDLKRKAEPVFAALEAYERDFGALPATLDALVPKYLSAGEPSATYSFKHQSITIVYKATWPSPGQVSCTRQVKMSTWSCHGYV
jgi:hypothetical protein